MPSCRSSGSRSSSASHRRSALGQGYGRPGRLLRPAAGTNGVQMISVRTTAMLVGLALSWFTAGAAAADIDAGKAKAKEVCAACHGDNGNSATPDYPRL